MTQTYNDKPGPAIADTCQNAQVTVRTCEGYPLFYPNTAVGYAIASTDGVNTYCDNDNKYTGKDLFISEKSFGFQSYEAATRYFWFRWGINIAPFATTAALPETVDISGAKVENIAGTGKILTDPSSANVKALCNLTRDEIEGATAFTPADVLAGTDNPEPGDLVISTTGWAGIIIGTKTVKGGGSIEYVKQHITKAQATSPVTSASSKDSGICMYIHANNNNSTDADGCVHDFTSSDVTYPITFQFPDTGNCYPGGVSLDAALKGTFTNGKFTGTLSTTNDAHDKDIENNPGGVGSSFIIDNVQITNGVIASGATMTEKYAGAGSGNDQCTHSFTETNIKLSGQITGSATKISSSNVKVTWPSSGDNAENPGNQPPFPSGETNPGTPGGNGQTIYNTDGQISTVTVTGPTTSKGTNTGTPVTGTAPSQAELNP